MAVLDIAGHSRQETGSIPLVSKLQKPGTFEASITFAAAHSGVTRTFMPVELVQQKPTPHWSGRCRRIECSSYGPSGPDQRAFKKDANFSNTLLSVKVLSRLFRRLFLEYLLKAFDAGKLKFFSSLESPRDRSSFLDYLAALREAEWVVYAKRHFAGAEQVWNYVGRSAFPKQRMV
jgi:hypothetical protein